MLSIKLTIKLDCILVYNSSSAINIGRQSSG